MSNMLHFNTYIKTTTSWRRGAKTTLIVSTRKDLYNQPQIDGKQAKIKHKKHTLHYTYRTYADDECELNPKHI